MSLVLCCIIAISHLSDVADKNLMIPIVSSKQTAEYNFTELELDTLTESNYEKFSSITP